MPLTASNGDETGPRPPGLITVGEWAEILTVLYRVLFTEVHLMEQRQNARGEKVENNPESNRYGVVSKRLLNVARSLEISYRANKDATNVSKTVEDALNRVRDARQSLREKMDEVFGPEKTSTIIRDDNE
jgi:hypothetical protein